MTERQKKQAVIYRFGRFEIDTREQLLRCEGEIVSLSRKVFETLLFLVENNGRMLSKEEIMNALWADAFVEETNLTSNISRLRKILHSDNSEYIETFPKRGYRFRGEVEAISAETEIVVKRRVTTRVRQIIEETDDADFQPEYAAALETLPNNLSIPTTPLIGRERELAALENLLRRENSKLVTLTGIGGTGKTRLAMEIACRLLSEFSDGVFFIPLAAIKNPDFVVGSIAQPFGVKETGSKTLIDALKDFLRDKQMLLVIDNFEQIISAAPILSELLQAAPRLKILATSRALLRLNAEREFLVPPLALPDEIAASSFAELSETESVKLFAERAKAIKPNFSLTTGNARVTAEICRQLDGLPLAIELAAARMKILSPQQILQRLENRLKLLTGGARDLPARQQTMRGAIQWSFDLLDKDEKILFRHLSVFAGGFTVEAAEAASNYELRTTNDEIDVLNCLTSLVENSLLVQAEQADGESRFRMLAVVREFAQEVLEASGESEIIRKNHAEFFLRLAQEAEPQILSQQGTKWLDRLEEEHDNLRAAFSWSAANDAETTVNLAAALRDFWVFRNHLTEGRAIFETALQRASDAPAAVRFKLLNGLGQVVRYQGDYAAGQKAYEEGLAAGKAENDWRQIALSNRGLAAVAKHQGDFAAAQKFYQEALRIGRELNDKFVIAVSVNAMGDLARVENDYAAARPLFEEALAICRQLGNHQGVNCTLNNLGAVAFGEGDYEAARSFYAQALAAAQESGERITLSYSLDGFAALAAKCGKSEIAVQLASAAEHLRESLGFEIEPAELRFRNSYLAELRDALDEETFAKLYEQGRALRLEKIIEIAGA